MASSALADKFKNKPPSKFGDEGEPDMESPPRGGGAGADDGNDTTSDDSPDSASTNGMPPDDGDGDEKAAEDLADMLGVGAEDRPNFAAALQAYVQAQIAKALGGGAPPGAEPDEDDAGSSPMIGSPGPGAGGEMGA